MCATGDAARRKFLVATDSLRNGSTFIRVWQARVNALPKRLGERDAFRKRKRHCVCDKLLTAHSETVTSAKGFVKNNDRDSPSTRQALGVRLVEGAVMPQTEQYLSILRYQLA